jgi:putative membrane protein
VIWGQDVFNIKGYRRLMALEETKTSSPLPLSASSQGSHPRDEAEKNGRPLSGRMKTGMALFALAGIALATALILYFGSAQVGEAFLTAGWRGLAAMTGVYFASLVLCALAWRCLIIAPHRNATLLCHWARLLRDSVANILAVVPAAGEVVAARELSIYGLNPGAAGATTVVDLTMEIVSLILFALLGLAILSWQQPGESIAWWSLGALAVSAVAMAGFIAAQRGGLFRFLESLADRLGLTAPWSDPDQSRSIHAGINDIYSATSRPIASGALHFVAWVVGSGEAWLALSFMGHPLDFSDVLVIESLLLSLRMAVFVPWAAGVQEGGYVALGALFGLGPDIALGLSLLKRAREVLTGVPCLLVWQAFETRRLWRASRR